MITITDAAQDKIQEILANEDESNLALRMQIMGRGPGGFRYSLRFVPQDQQQADDEKVEFEQFSVLIDAESAENMKGSSVDFKQDTFRSGFMIDNPNPGLEGSRSPVDPGFTRFQDQPQRRGTRRFRILVELRGWHRIHRVWGRLPGLRYGRRNPQTGCRGDDQGRHL